MNILSLIINVGTFEYLILELIEKFKEGIFQRQLDFHYLDIGYYYYYVFNKKILIYLSNNSVQIVLTRWWVWVLNGCTVAYLYLWYIVLLYRFFHVEYLECFPVRSVHFHDSSSLWKCSMLCNIRYKEHQPLYTHNTDRSTDSNFLWTKIRASLWGGILSIHAELE